MDGNDNGSNVSVKRYNMNGGQMMSVHNQWANRPPDQIFDSLEAAYEKARGDRARAVNARAHASSLRADVKDDGLVIVGKSGSIARPTHFAFGQLAGKVGAPPSYLRKLSPGLAAQCVNEGLERRGKERDEDEPEALYMHQNDDGVYTLNALLSPKYQRVYQVEDIESLMRLRDRFPGLDLPTAYLSAARMSGTGDGTATWGDDGASGSKLPTIYMSDRDLFAFLTDQTRTVEVRGAHLFRGLIFEDSEVGELQRKATLFLFDAICGNCILWGVQDVMEIGMRHVGKIRERSLGEDADVMKAISGYLTGSAGAIEAGIERAQNRLVADTKDDVVSRIMGKRIAGLTETAIEAAYEIAETTPRYGDPRSAWGIVSGLTEYSQRTPYQGERKALDKAAGKILSINF